MPPTPPTTRAPSPGTLFVVATPIGNLEDITLRALRVLREVSVIAAEDTRRTSRLLGHYGITTRTMSLHEHNEHDRTPGVVERLLAGESIAIVTDAGTPLLSDPGRLLAAEAAARGVRVEPIPGASAVLAALVRPHLFELQQPAVDVVLERRAIETVVEAQGIRTDGGQPAGEAAQLAHLSIEGRPREVLDVVVELSLIHI